MNNTNLRYGIAAAAVVFIAFLGFNLIPGKGIGESDPSASSVPSAVAAPSQRANVPGDYEPIAPGRTLYRPPWNFGYSMGNWIRGDLILTMPSGWDQLATSRGAGMDGASTTLRAGVAGPVCAPADSEAEESSGLSVEEFVAAITSAPALQATRADATLAGFDGSVVNLTVPRTFSCDGGNGWNTGALEGRSSFVEGFGMPWAPGSHHELWVLDVEGVTFVLDAGYDADATAAEREELRAIVASAEFKLY
jgi:hypothetical protein